MMKVKSRVWKSFSKLYFCSYFIHNFIKILQNEMFYTKKCNYFSHEKRWECLILSQIPVTCKGETLDLIERQGLIASTVLPKVYSIFSTSHYCYETGNKVKNLLNCILPMISHLADVFDETKQQPVMSWAPISTCMGPLGHQIYPTKTQFSKEGLKWSKFAKIMILIVFFILTDSREGFKKKCGIFHTQWVVWV